ncbi:HAD family phosphatase [Nanchangia anserum]|uniref:HAD family phosphatase n=1 Tax=Nanchangia anserum TaxID=2692125 RepID=A0A8I0G6T3_9ACTO|nr:HAD family hydrolase [Nanchangia anserum]MBD3688860.1 HAD family phosphatase [Nanchangia anserum]QOX81132.1 HAD family phosphatase [Nanchangia anserum]
MTASRSRSWSTLPALPTMRLVVADMDGTLLDGEGRIPDGFADIARELAERGIVFAPASGRQLATLTDMFPDLDSFVAENGTIISHAGRARATTTLPDGVWRDVVQRARTLAGIPRVGIIVCGVASAYIEDSREDITREASRYYHRLRTVEDLLEIEDQVVKIAIYDAVDASARVAQLGEIAECAEFIVSGQNWLDIMPTVASKGRASLELAESLGIAAEDIVTFGDFLNDMSLMTLTPWSFAMANAHPDVRAAAAYEAPANTEAGVIQVLQRLLGLA